MAHAKRHYLHGHVWHITHRCHKKEFLLKLVKDRHSMVIGTARIPRTDSTGI